MTVGRPTVTFAVVVCLLVAGCGSVSDGGDPGAARGPTATVTPAPLPTETPPERTATPPPGQSVTVAALADVPAEHAAALSNRSFTAIERQVVVDGGGAVYDVTATLRVVGDRYRYDRTRIADPSYPGPQGIDTLALYHWDDRTAFRDEDDGGVRYGVVDGAFRFGPGTDRTGEEFLADLLPAFGNWTTTSVDGGRLLRGSDLVDPGALDTDRRLGSTGEATVRLRVTESGRVSWLRLEYEATLNGRSVTVRVERRYTEVGSTAVDEPPWLDEALGTERDTAEVVRP